MSAAPDPAEIFARGAEEGRRRLDQSLVELVSTSFIAGFTIVFGIGALGVTRGFLDPAGEGVATVAGSLAFGVGLVFLIVSRVELFNENFFDPIAAAVERQGSWLVWPLVRLWSLTFAFNLVGGALFALVFAVEGVLPPEALSVLVSIGEHSVGRGVTDAFVNAIVGGALVALLSYLLAAVDGVGGRIAVAYMVGVVLALAPFEHVVVTALHVFLGMLLGAEVGLRALVETVAVVTVGNAVGGLGLVTLSHVAQVSGEEGESTD